MEARTLTFLHEMIEKEYAWRIIELSNFRSSLLVENNEKAKKAKIRAGVALLYSHWEGFIKKIADFYYQYVGYQNQKIENLNDAFISISLRSELNLLFGSNKLKIHNTIIKKLLSEKEKVAFFPKISPIKTSNLRFQVFEDVCVLLGIEPKDFEERFKRKFDRNIQLTIDEDFVDKRNSIAHGEYLSVSIDDFKKLYDIVINGFLFNFKEMVMDSAQNKRYLRIVYAS
jgi:hypothetical protein